MDGTLGDTSLVQMLCPLDHRIPGVITHIFVAQTGNFSPFVKPFDGMHVVGACMVTLIFTMSLDAHPHLTAQ